MKLRAKNPTGFLSDDNRLMRVQGPGGLDVSYTYDTSGRMMTRTSGGVTTRFTWDGFDCVREQTGSSVTIYHIPDGMLHSFSLDGAVFQCHSDALGSVRMITDASGAVVARIEYGAWGEEIFVSAIPALANFPYRFVGGEGVRTDSETGLVYMRARWYDPELARFISRDPIGLEGGANLFTYVGNNPVAITDSFGLRPKPYQGVVPFKIYLRIKKRYRDCYNEIVKKWGRCPRTGAVEDVTYYGHPNTFGCCDWVDALLACLSRYESEFEGYGISPIDVWVSDPWIQHHAIVVGPINDFSPEEVTVLDPWIEGKPGVWRLDIWLKASNATDWKTIPNPDSFDPQYLPGPINRDAWNKAMQDAKGRK